MHRATKQLCRIIASLTGWRKPGHPIDSKVRDGDVNPQVMFVVGEGAL
jgi:hypothetical protein